jgi:crotonobetainyl-CoA:carnitine CoA-transferase CaiB-like acyl-CoA transferase
MSGEFLKGYRALDLTGWGGQLCGRILADLGMEVIKIEPPGGDRRNLALSAQPMAPLAWPSRI